MTFDLVIPFYNPPTDWEHRFYEKYARLVDTCFEGRKDAINLIIVNDGSSRHFTDSAIQYLKRHIPLLTVVSYTENRGKGYALRRGVEKATHEYCIYSDHDFPFGLEIVPNMLKELQNGADIVTGCRKKGNYFSSLPFKRRMVSKSLILFNKRFLRLPVHDTQAGIKAFNKYGKVLFLQTDIDRFLFDMEFILLAKRVKDIVIRSLNVSITQDTKLSDFGMKVMNQEFKNLLQIVFKGKNETTTKQDII